MNRTASPRHLAALAVLVAFASLSSLASAQTPPPGAPDPTEPPGPVGIARENPTDDFDVSQGSRGNAFEGVEGRAGFGLTISPLHLFSPVALVTGEYAFFPKFSADLTLGFGRVTITDPYDRSPTPGSVHRAIEIVVPRLRYYVLGEYLAGFPVALGLKYVRVDSDQLTDVVLFNATNSVAAEAVIGIKYVFRTNLVFDFLGGVDLLLKHIKPADPVQPGVTASLPRNAFLMFAFDIGYAF